MFHPIWKPWGYTYRIPQPNGSEIHVAFIRGGGSSSEHLHDFLVNGFFVVSGRLKIIQQIGPDIVLEGNGFAGEPRHDFLAVETRNFHGFEALEDTILVEAYGRVDIKRKGGVT